LLVWLALAGIHLAIGVAWLGRNVDTVPDYGDTGDYLQLARTLEVDAYRGIAYPAFIAGLNRLPGGAGLLRSAGRDASGTKLKAGVLYLQTIQLLASLAGFAYFLRVFVARVEPLGASPWIARGASVLLLLLLLFDPLVAHFGLSIMTDSLALAASLAFCAALADFGLGRSRRWISGPVLLASFVLAATLRVEKLWVLACATLATLAAWLFLQRRAAPEERAFSLVRAVQIAGIVLAGSLTVSWLHRSAHVDSRRWPMVDSMLHARIVFPNLSKVYDQLPKNVQARLSQKDAQRHDTDSIVGYRVINDATGASGPIRVKDRRALGQGGTRPSVERERRAMLETIAGVVLRERWLALALDIVKDALENVAATLSFHVRLGVLARTGDVSCADGTQKTYEVLSQRNPRLSLWYVASSVLLVLASSVLAVAALVRRRRSGAPIERRRLVVWVPVAAFVLANACAFALRADMVHIRYMLLAHAAFLVLVFRGALDWLAAGKVTPQPPAPA
jgi:hypothetical protein